MGESGAWRIHQSAMMMCGWHFFKCYEESMQVGTNPGVSCATSLGWGLHSESLTGGRSSRLGRLYSCRVNDATSSMLGGRLFENHLSVSVQSVRAKKLGWSRWSITFLVDHPVEILCYQALDLKFLPFFLGGVWEWVVGYRHPMGSIHTVCN